LVPKFTILPTWNVLAGVFTGQSGAAWVNTPVCGGTCTTHAFSVGDIVNFGTNGSNYTPYLCIVANTGLRPDQNLTKWVVKYALQSGFLDYHLMAASAPVGAATTLPSLPATVPGGTAYAQNITIAEDTYPVFPFGDAPRSSVVDSGAIPYIASYAPAGGLTITGPSTVRPGDVATYTVTLSSAAATYTPVVFMSSSETDILTPYSTYVQQGQTTATASFTVRGTAVAGDNVTMHAFAYGGFSGQIAQVISGAPIPNPTILNGAFTLRGVTIR